MTHYECVSVALGIHHAMRMCHIVIWARPDVQYFLHFSKKGTIFKEEEEEEEEDEEKEEEEKENKKK